MSSSSVNLEVLISFKREVTKSGKCFTVTLSQPRAVFLNWEATDVIKGFTNCVDSIQQKVKFLPFRLSLILVLFSGEIIASVINFYTDLTLCFLLF
jgi:hypothetical protein